MARFRATVISPAVLVLLTYACVGAEVTTTTAPVVTTAPSETTTAPVATTAAPAVEAGGEITVAAALGLTQLDPHKPLFIFDLVFWPLLWDSVTAFTQEGGDVPQPWIAEDWSVSDDGLTWTLNIKQGVTFSNGKDLTADDVAGSILRIADPETGFFLQSLFEIIVDARAVDDFTVEVVLSRPSASFLVNMTKVMVADLDAVDQIAESPIGSGRYIVEDFVPDDHVTMVPNPSYWGDPPPLDRLRLVRAEDNTSALTALFAGDVQAVAEPAWPDIPRLLGDPTLEVITRPSEPPTVMHIMMDTTSPPFDDPVARQAVAYAVDRQTIIDALFAGQGLATNNNVPIPPDSPALASGLPDYEYNPERARELFEQAGITDLTYWTTPLAQFTPMGEVLQASFAEIGVTLAIEEAEVGTWVARFAPAGKEWPGLLIPNFYTGFTSPQILGMWAGFCECNYDSAEFEDLLARADQSPDSAERDELYRQAQLVFAEDAPVAFVQAFSIPFVVQSNVMGVWINPVGYIQLQEMGYAE